MSARGAVGSVQPIGAEPKHQTDSRVAYGTGALLMAGSEILRAMGGAAKIEPGKLLQEAAMLVGVPNLSKRGLRIQRPPIRSRL